MARNKIDLRGGKTNVFDFFLHKDIRNKRLGKVKNFQVWFVRRFFEYMAYRVKKYDVTGVCFNMVADIYQQIKKLVIFETK